MLAACVLDPGSRKNGLNGSIFTRSPMQREKHNVGVAKVGGLDIPPGLPADHLKLVLGGRSRSDTARQQTLLLYVGQNTAKRIDRNHSMPRLTQCFGYLSATGDRHITFRTIATKKNGYFHDKNFYRLDDKTPSGFSLSRKKTKGKLLSKRVKWRNRKKIRRKRPFE